jgi:hypothetical protein
MLKENLKIQCVETSGSNMLSPSLQQTKTRRGLRITRISFLADDQEGGSCATVLGNNDILCGRGSVILRHIGNVRFRRIIVANKECYAKCKKNSHKLFMAISILAAIERKGGRFLRRKDEKDENSTLIIMRRKDAIGKIAQALRDQIQPSSDRRERSKSNAVKASVVAKAGAQESSPYDFNDHENYDKASDKSAESDGRDADVLPIDHQAATQPLIGFSRLMSSFCSMVDAPLPTAHQIGSGNHEVDQLALRRRLYQQSRPVARSSSDVAAMAAEGDHTSPSASTIWVPQELETLVLSDPNAARALCSLT